MLLYINILTIFLHVDLQALPEAARLALVASGYVHNTVAVLLTHVVQCPAQTMQSAPTIIVSGNYHAVYNV